MKNNFWLYCITKKNLNLIIDIHDANYIKQSREERFSELKSLLMNDIMNIKVVYVYGEDNFDYLEVKKSWYAIERIAEIHQFIEKSYTWLTAWDYKNPVFDSGSLALDESYDNSQIAHYKLTPLGRREVRLRNKEGKVYIKKDGETYAFINSTERRVCELVWEAFQGEIPQGFKITHIDGNKQNNRLDNLKLVKEEIVA